MLFDQVTVIGGGLAGSECAIQLADRGFTVKLCEMRPQVSSPAHHTDHLAELVCSNSFKSTRPDSAAGLLKAELERRGRPPRRRVKTKVPQRSRQRRLNDKHFNAIKKANRRKPGSED